MKSFDERLVAALNAVRMTVMWLSNEAEIDYARLDKLHRGEETPTNLELGRLALVLNCSAVWLATGNVSAQGRRLYEQLSEMLPKDHRANDPIVLKPRDFFRLRTFALMITGDGALPPPQ